MYKTRLVKPYRYDRNRRITGFRIADTKRLIDFESKLGDKTSFSIGRTHQRDVRIDDESVSRLHCIIKRTSRGVYRIIDCDSGNGVRVFPLGRYCDAIEVESYELHVGMQIQLGEVILTPTVEGGACPMIVTTHSELLRDGIFVYGSPSCLARNIHYDHRNIYRFQADERAKRYRR